jgi:Fe-S cluster assembly iron-binding protein IscA
MSDQAQTTIEALKQKRVQIKADAAAKIADIKAAERKKAAALRAAIRKAATQEARERKKRDDHAKIMVGVGAIYFVQNDAEFRSVFERKLAEFYEKAPEKLEAAQHGLKLKVNKPEGNSDRDDPAETQASEAKAKGATA